MIVITQQSPHWSCYVCAESIFGEKLNLFQVSSVRVDATVCLSALNQSDNCIQQIKMKSRWNARAIAKCEYWAIMMMWHLWIVWKMNWLRLWAISEFIYGRARRVVFSSVPSHTNANTDYHSAPAHFHMESNALMSQKRSRYWWLIKLNRDSRAKTISPHPSILRAFFSDKITISDARVMRELQFFVKHKNHRIP